MDANTLLQTLRRWDDERPAVPAEHWLKLSLGLGLLAAGGRGSVLGRALSIAAGGALVYRAFKGKDGLSEMLRREPRHQQQHFEEPGTVEEHQYAGDTGRGTTLVDGKVAASVASPAATDDVDIDMMEPQTRLVGRPQSNDEVTSGGDSFTRSGTMP